MRATIFREPLRDALASVLWAVPGNAKIPILGNVRIEMGGAGLSIRATDLDDEAEARVSCDVRDAGVCTVPAKLLHRFVSALPDGSSVILEATDDRAALKLLSGRVKASLHTLPASDFPDLAALEFSHRFKLKGSELRQLLDRTAFAAASSAVKRPALCGVYLHEAIGSSSPALRAVATDGHRLACADLALPEGVAGMPALILSREAVAGLVKLCTDKPGEIDIEISAQRFRVTIESDAFTTIVTSKAIAYDFPDYMKVIPVGNNKELTVDRAEFTAAVDRVLTVAGARGSCIKLSAAPDLLKLSAYSTLETKGGGHISDVTGAEEMEVEYAADNLDIGCNGQLLLEFVSSLDDEVLVLRLDTPGTQILVEPKGREDQRYVLMPMRI